MKNERSFLTSQWPTWWRNSPTSQSLRAEFPRSVAWEDLHRAQTHFTLPRIDANLGTLQWGLSPILTKRSGERLYITLDADVPFIVVTQNWSKAVDKQFIAHAQIGFDRTQFNNGWLTYLKYLYFVRGITTRFTLRFHLYGTLEFQNWITSRRVVNFRVYNDTRGSLVSSGKSHRYKLWIAICIHVEYLLAQCLTFLQQTHTDPIPKQGNDSWK